MQIFMNMEKVEHCYLQFEKINVLYISDVNHEDLPDYSAIPAL
jgi:hypothetical protein